MQPSSPGSIWGPMANRRRYDNDRFIKVMSTEDLDFANYWLTERKQHKDSPTDSLYLKCLKECVFEGRTHVLFDSKRPRMHTGCLSSRLLKLRKKVRKAPDMMLDAPGVLDDYYVNLLEWGSSGILTIGLDKTVYLWNESDGSVSELATFESSVNSISWSPNGQRLAIGLRNAEIQLWDLSSHCLVITLQGANHSRVGAIVWKNHTLTTAWKNIVIYDVRAESHVFQTYRGHQGRVCALKWSKLGRYLASGGDDGLVRVWDPLMAREKCLHRIKTHVNSAKALMWNPSRTNLLASGACESDRHIGLWNMSACTLLEKIDTGSQVSEIPWSNEGREFLTSHGSPTNELALWNYPSMTKIEELCGHHSRVLFMAQSPDGSTVASAAADETLQIWNDVLPKIASETSIPFGGSYLIRTGQGLLFFQVSSAHDQMQIAVKRLKIWSNKAELEFAVEVEVLARVTTL